MDTREILERLEKLSDEKRALLIEALLSDSPENGKSKSIKRRTRAGHIPLSFSQQRLWFLDNLEPGNSFYSIPVAVRITGPLDVPALERTFNEIVRRHESLRTTFKLVGDRAEQIISPSLSLGVRLIDLTRAPEAQREEDARALSYEETKKPFDLSAGPLLRVSLLKMGVDEYIALVVMHHIVTDGWSVRLLIREVAVIYDAFISGKPSPLADLPIQYADFSCWQREWLQGAVLESQLSYWKRTLSNSPALLELPFDNPRPAVQTFPGRRDHINLPKHLVDSLKAVGSRENATLFMVLLAAFKTLLYRYSGQEDIVVGTPIAGRKHIETEALIGLFVNTLAMRTDLSGDPTFLELLKRVHKVALEAYAHQDLPFEKLVEELKPERSLSHSPIFQVMFILHNTPDHALEMSGLVLRQEQTETGASKFDMTLQITEMAEATLVSLEYNSDLFAHSTISRFLHHFESLLGAIAADPDLPISLLPLLTAGERRQLLEECAGEERQPGTALCIHELFERQAEKTPDRVALVCGQRRVSYRELNSKANAVATYLVGLGVRAESVVGICMDRTVETVEVMLGVLKAGAAYLPLDPGHPGERLSYMIKDAGVREVIAQERYEDRLKGEGVRVVSVDRDGEEIMRGVGERVRSEAGGENAAYVIYTSGSTGKPKGVVGSHRASVNRFSWMWRTYPFLEHEVCCQKTSLSFVDSIWEIFGPLLQGIPLVIIPDDAVKDPRRLVETLGLNRVTRIVLVPSVLRLMLDTFSDLQSRLPALKYWVSSGEALSAGLANAFMKSMPDATLLNLYGSSEVAGDSTWHEVPRGESLSRVPIGRAIDNTRVYVLDGPLQPVPVGAAGQVFISSDSLARCYINQPELTAERFIPDPFSRGRGGRLYKTGDRAKYSAGGDIEYLGRLDNQVKVRGIRVEVGEIESALVAQPAISEAVVVSREDTPGDSRLVAYIVRREAELKLEWLRSRLKETLPEYMVPSAFVMLKRLPLTPSGKVDRRALPPPDHQRPDLEIEFVEPRGETEVAIADIWRRLLNVEKVGAYDNFFTLGGHSLTATLLLSRMSHAFGVELPLRQVFKTPTVAGLAESIEQETGARPSIQEHIAVTSSREGEVLPSASQRTEALDHLESVCGSSVADIAAATAAKAAGQLEGLREPPVEPSPSGRAHSIARRRGLDYYPLSFAQQRLWFVGQLAPDSPLYNMTAALQIMGPLDTDALEQSFNEVVRRHEALRTKIVVSEGQPSQVICEAEPLKLGVFDLSGLPQEGRDAEVRQIMRRQAGRPFDLGRGALLRAGLIKLSEQHHMMTLAVHHIVSDAWSMGLLVREVGALYEAYSTGRPSPLPELPIQYADFALWQRDCLRGEIVEKHLSYWRERLGGTVQLLDLPAVGPRRSAHSYRGGRVPVSIGRGQTDALKQLARRNNVTLFMTLLATFKTLLYRYTGQEDILVGTPVANRNRVEVENLIGLFLNALVLRTDLSGDPDFEELLARVKEVTLGAFAHQDVPFEKLIEVLRPERGQVDAPLLQVMFVLQNAPMPTLALSNLTISPVQTEAVAAEFDITLSLTERNDSLQGVLDYSTDLFDEPTIRRMVGHFQVLSDAIATQATLPISSLPLLSEAERDEILNEWNDTAAAYPHELCIHRLFEAQVERAPDALAVICEQQGLSYAELNYRANRSANRLLELGVGPDVRVGVCVEQSLDMIVGLLAVLKAGGAYVPLDPEYPGERLASMMAGAGVKVLLTQRRLAGAFAGSGVPAVCLDSGGDTLRQGGGENPASNVDPGNLAYVIYTSGSTGQAKGVMVPHRAVVNTLSWRISTYSLTDADRVLQNIPFTFDPSVWQIFGALLSGATLILPRPGGHKDVGYLIKRMAEREVSIADFPPSLLRVLLDEEGLGECKNLRYVFSGGEALAADVQERFIAASRAQLCNQYGPTETTVDATYWEGQHSCGRRLVPIGRPISNTQVYVLDHNLEPVPVGITGELYIAGAGVSRGYLDMPELTAERFMPNPLSGEAGARLYKTGDLTRYLETGVIEFLGRIDYQVKIRGVRIETGEVEAALAECPGVTDAIVVAREDGQADKQLVAYVAADGQSPVTAFELRSRLRSRLPDFMLPSHFVILDKLPYASTGKIDRQALPAPILTRADQPTPYVPARTPIEEVLVQIWEELLKLDRVGIQDNFFIAGGHSLMSMQLLSQVRKKFGVDLPLRNFFERPTVEGLADEVEEALIAKSSPDSVDELLDMLEGVKEGDTQS